MFARKSTDNGVSWQPDMAVLGRSESFAGIPGGGMYAYDYQMAIATSHRTAWMDGRVAINGIQQRMHSLTASPRGQAHLHLHRRLCQDLQKHLGLAQRPRRAHSLPL